MRADFSFIKLDDTIECGGFDISLVDQYRFERAHPQLHLGKVGALIVIVIMCSHGGNIQNETGGVHPKTEARIRVAQANAIDIDLKRLAIDALAKSRSV